MVLGVHFTQLCLDPAQKLGWNQRLLQEIIKGLEAEKDLLSTLQAWSNSSTTNSAYSPQHSIASSAERSCHTSEENEHSSKCSFHTFFFFWVQAIPLFEAY